MTAVTEGFGPFLARSGEERLDAGWRRLRSCEFPTGPIALRTVLTHVYTERSLRKQELVLSCSSLAILRHCPDTIPLFFRNLNRMEFCATVLPVPDAKNMHRHSVQLVRALPASV